MDNNSNCQPVDSNVVDVKSEINTKKGKINTQCCPNHGKNIGGIGGIDSSLLFFFLILVCIVCQYDCGIEIDTLLWFFLVLVMIYKQCDM